MSLAVMRNRVSTEFRKVEQGSDEYLELQAQRDPNDGLPVWEETSLPNAIEQSKRLEDGNPMGHDIGDAQQPVGRITGAHETYVPAGSVREPLPSEREAGAEQPEDELAGLPPHENHIEEVPQNASMESSTDTEVGGTEPDLTEARTKQTASKSSGGGKSKSKKADAPAEADQEKDAQGK